MNIDPVEFYDYGQDIEWDWDMVQQLMLIDDIAYRDEECQLDDYGVRL